MTRPPVLGVDGALDGGAVLLDEAGRRGVAWGWRRRQRKSGTIYVLRMSYRCEGEREVELASLHEVSLEIARRLPMDCEIVVEDLFVPHPSQEDLETRDALQRYLGRVRSTQTLAEAVGEIVGPLRSRARSAVVRVEASAWRKTVLGSGSLSSSRSEELAIEQLTRRRPPLVSGLGVLAKDPHVAEAALLSCFGWLQLNPAQRPLLGR